MLYNYHTHTFRCGHATGEDEEYVKNAIRFGVQKMGFSDHGPFRHENGFELGHRVPAALAEDYIASIRALREKYKNEIEIHIGFEAEYCPKYFDKMLAYWKKLGAEYLILGNHLLGDELNGCIFSVHKDESEEKLVSYVDCTIEGMKTGVFSYVAHPDVINFSGANERYDAEMRRLAEASKQTGIPVEVNCLGIREGRFYPDERFWKIAGEVGCPVVIGFDAHEPKSAGAGAMREKATEIVKRFGLRYEEDPKLIRI